MNRLFEKKQQGVAMVEFALVAMVFLPILFAIFEIGLAVWVYNNVAESVREGGRYAVVHGKDTRLPTGEAGPDQQGPVTCNNINSESVAAVVCEKALALDPEKLTVTTSWPNGNYMGNTVIVYGKYAFTPLSGLVDISVDLESQSEMTIACCSYAPAP